MFIIYTSVIFLISLMHVQYAFSFLYSLRRLHSRLRKRYKHEDRLIFLPTLDELSFSHLIEMSTLLLDPYLFGGGVTLLEAFASCKAVVTLPSLQSVPALTAGMIRKMGLMDALIAKSRDHFIQIAKNLISNNSSFRNDIENKICKQNYLLYEQQNVVHEWETLFRKLGISV